MSESIFVPHLGPNHCIYLWRDADPPSRRYESKWQKISVAKHNGLLSNVGRTS